MMCPNIIYPDDENGEGQQDSVYVAEELSEGRQTLGVAARELVEAGPAQASV